MSVLNNIRLICFDLDDTLWPCMPTIQKAEAIFYQWLESHRPEIVCNYSQEQLRQKRKLLREREPALAHDMSLLRIQSLIELAEEFGYAHTHGNNDWIAEVFDVFYQARQLVRPYDDVLPALQTLKADYVLASATNGNADIYQTELADWFEHAVSAAEAGVSKPNPAMFELLQKKTGFTPDQILHIGDHPEDDVQAAGRAGIRSVWLNRQQQGWPGGEYSPDFTVANMTQLLSLFTNRTSTS